MHPDTRKVSENMLKFGMANLGRAAYQSTFSDMGAPFAHSMAVVQAAQGAELVLKARIAQEHPLLILSSFPKSTATNDQLGIKELFELGRTIQYHELPEALWAATGYRMAKVDQFQQFGRLRNSLMHFGAVEDYWPADTLVFLFEVMESITQEFWQWSICDAAEEWDEIIVSEGYLEQALDGLVEITPELRAVLDRLNPEHRKP